jgi:SAM-dependent methyltransferase
VKLLRLSIEFSNKIFGRVYVKRLQKVPRELSIVRLNLGCGLAVTKGWVNIDASLNALVAAMPTPFHAMIYRLTGARHYFSESEYCSLLRNHIFIHHDLTNGIPFEDGVADFIYSSHFIEHLYREDAKHLLNDCYRVLKNNGVLRISVPDLEYALKLYFSGNKQRMLQNYFFVEDSGSHYARHKYMYDFEMLSAILGEIGFHDIQRCGFQKGATPDINILDKWPEDSLFVEARK